MDEGRGGGVDRTYLTAVELVLAQFGVVGFFDRFDLHALELADPLDEHLPHFFLGFDPQFSVPQTHVDAALEGFVEGDDPVGGQEDNALEILEQPQEDGDQSVAPDVVE